MAIAWLFHGYCIAFHGYCIVFVWLLHVLFLEIALLFMGGMSVRSVFQFRGTSKTTLLHHSQGEGAGYDVARLPWWSCWPPSTTTTAVWPDWAYGNYKKKEKRREVKVTKQKTGNEKESRIHLWMGAAPWVAHASYFRFLFFTVSPSPCFSTLPL